MSEMVTIKVVVDTGYPGCNHEDEIEMEKSEWSSMSEKEQEKYLEGAASQLVINTIDSYAHVVEHDIEE